MSKNDGAKEVLEYILKCLVNYPYEVKVKQTDDDEGTFIRVSVDKRDMGMVVGRGGSHIEAIKLITKLVAFKVNAKVSIKLEEPKSYGKK